MTPCIVAKFGGTSMGDASAMQKSAAIVAANPNIRLVTVSAISGITNQLLKIYEYSIANLPTEILQAIQTLEDRHDLIANKLGCLSFVAGELNMLYQELGELTLALQAAEDSERLALRDQLLSIGERLSATLFTTVLNAANIKAKCFDVRSVMITDNHFGKAEPQIENIATCCAQRLLPLMNNKTVIVTQGFIGATAAGQTTTLGRGGSDYSAALLAESLSAKELQIWTDVPGIMTMDPNAIPSAKVIPKMSFAEAAELANFGAKVLHPATLWPAIRKNICVLVASTFAPELGGTWIHPETDDIPTVRALALRKNQTLITVTSLRMLNAHGFLAKLFGILAHHRFSVDLVTTSEVSVALTIDGNQLGASAEWISHYAAMLDELREFCDVTIEEHLTLVAIVGNGLTATAGLNARTFNSIAKSNVRLICYGASSHNLCFLVKQEDALEVVRELHNEWITPMLSACSPSKIA